jgi:2-aminoethylphosphonate-pyruvate transaminase
MTMNDDLFANPYLLLTPGPATTTRTVRQAMLRDWCTWDDDYHRIVQDIRARLVALVGDPADYTAVLMQGSGTFSVESVITSVVPADGRLLVLANGVYGRRIVEIACRAGIATGVIDAGELAPPDPARLDDELRRDPAITHVAVVHCETTSGMLNPIERLGPVVARHGKVFVVDAMSSFGGIPIDNATVGADFLISSSNKCIQGVPGFGFVVARRRELERTVGRARSLSLDLVDQWRTMEQHGGKWRFTSPTHVVRAFAQALAELEQEGGVARRHARYAANHERLVAGMQELGFRCLLAPEHRSPIITSFCEPEAPGYDFRSFYQRLKERGFVIYPGKVTERDTFRIGTIGDVRAADIDRLLVAVGESMSW